MTTEFSVLPWLREVRDRHARETEGLTAEERVAALERETHDWAAAFLNAHPGAVVREVRGQAKVAETRAPYGRKR
jgi:hypothetical protein